MSAELTGHGIDVRVIDPSRPTGISQDTSEVVIDLAGAADGLCAAYLVGADDARLVVRERLGTDEPHRAGRVFFAGDGGVGDAYNLAWKLAAAVRGASDELLLDSYAEERSPAARNARFGPDETDGLGRLLGLLERIRPSRRTDPTAANYRGCRLSHHSGGARPLIRAGDPVPEIRLWHIGDGTERRLSELLGRRWTVIGLGSVSAATVAEVTERFGAAVHGEVIGGGTGTSGVPGVTVIDRRGEARQRLGRRGGTVLVIRPDGYVGLVGRPRPEIVQAYLEDLIPPESPDENV